MVEEKAEKKIVTDNRKDENPHIKVLNAKEHGDLGFVGCGDCTMCCDGSTYTCAGVLLDELFDTAKLFPVVFSKTDDRINLILMYTLRKGVPCPYLDTQKQLCKVYDSIRPRACKIYPFNIREMPGQDPKNPQYSVVFDARCPGLKNGAAGTPLIGEDGRLSQPITRNFIGEHMMRRYRRNVINTQIFLRMVRELDLLVEERFLLTDITVQGRAGMNSAQIWKISEEKLAALSKEAVIKLHQRGYFNAIYTHLNSLRNLGKLIESDHQAKKPAMDFFNFRI